MRTSCRLFAVVVALACLPAAADEIDDLASQAMALAAKSRQLEVRLPEAPSPGADYAQRRALDGEVLYRLKQYEQAAIVLLDVVEKFPHSRAYSDALFYLAESLYQKRDFLSAKRYFTRLVSRGQHDQHYLLSLQRLVELSLRTGDYSSVERHLGLLEQVPAHLITPSVLYVKGKYYFFRNRHDDARRVLATVPPQSEYYHQAQYIIATSFVSQRDFNGAIIRFTQVLRIKPRNEGEQLIQDLCYMALGRLFYEIGKPAKAVDQYQRVGRQSPVFPDALHETAWAFIKKGDLKAALRSLDLLLLARPRDVKAHELRVLMGGLHLRLDESTEALAIFEKTRERFEPLRAKLDDLISRRPDAKAFFHSLMTKRPEQFDVQVRLPEPAATWIAEEPLVKTATRVGTDIADIEESLAETQQLITRLERAVSAPSRVNIFPELARAREQALEIENAAAGIRARLAALQRDLTKAVLSATEQSQADQLARRREELQRVVSRMPKSGEGYGERAARSRRNYIEMEKRGQKLWVQIESLAAQLAALERYYADTRRQQKIAPAVFGQQIAEMRGLIKVLRGEYDRLRTDVISARETAGVGDETSQEEERIRRELRQVVDQEQALVVKALERLSGPRRTKVQQIVSVLRGLSQTEGRVTAFNARVDARVEERLREARRIIAEEKVKLAEYHRRRGAYAHESSTAGGDVTMIALKGARNRAYSLVVEADVGVIDVAWAHKDKKSRSVSRLQRELDRERRLLEEEFQQVRKAK